MLPGKLLPRPAAGRRWCRRPFHLFQWRDLRTLIEETSSAWNRHNAPRLGAALAFYTMFSLTPLLLIVVSIAGMAFGRQAAEGQIVWQVRDLVGATAAHVITGILQGAAEYHAWRTRFYCRVCRSIARRLRRVCGAARCAEHDPGSPGGSRKRLGRSFSNRESAPFLVQPGAGRRFSAFDLARDQRRPGGLRPILDRLCSAPRIDAADRQRPGFFCGADRPIRRHLQSDSGGAPGVAGCMAWRGGDVDPLYARQSGDRPVSGQSQLCVGLWSRRFYRAVHFMGLLLEPGFLFSKSEFTRSFAHRFGSHPEELSTPSSPETLQNSDGNRLRAREPAATVQSWRGWQFRNAGNQATSLASPE